MSMNSVEYLKQCEQTSKISNAVQKSKINKKQKSLIEAYVCEQKNKNKIVVSKKVNKSQKKREKKYNT